MDESRRERATNLWMALEACNSLLHEAHETGFVEPEGWTIQELETLVDDLATRYVDETIDFADPRRRVV